MTNEVIGDLENKIGFVLSQIEECEDKARALYEQRIDLESQLVAAKRANQEEWQQTEVIDIE